MDIKNAKKIKVTFIFISITLILIELFYLLSTVELVISVLSMLCFFFIFKLVTVDLNLDYLKSINSFLVIYCLIKDIIWEFKSLLLNEQLSLLKEVCNNNFCYNLLINWYLDLLYLIKEMLGFVNSLVLVKLKWNILNLCVSGKFYI